MVSNLPKIMMTFIFKNTQQKVLVLAVKIGFLEPNHVRDMEQSLATFDVSGCVHVGSAVDSLSFSLELMCVFS